MYLVQSSKNRDNEQNKKGCIKPMSKLQYCTKPSWNTL